MITDYLSTDSAEVITQNSALSIDPSTAGTPPTTEKSIQPTDDEEPPQGNVGIGILI